MTAVVFVHKMACEQKRTWMMTRRRMIGAFWMSRTMSRMSGRKWMSVLLTDYVPLDMVAAVGDKTGVSGIYYLLQSWEEMKGTRIGTALSVCKLWSGNC